MIIPHESTKVKSFNKIVGEFMLEGTAGGEGAGQKNIRAARSSSSDISVKAHKARIFCREIDKSVVIACGFAILWFRQ